MPEDTVCTNCNKPFRPRPHGKNLFCSQRCSALYRNQVLKVGRFNRPTAESKAKAIATRRRRMGVRWYERICTQCGSTFRVWGTRRTAESRIVCSTSCVMGLLNSPEVQVEVSRMNSARMKANNPMKDSEVRAKLGLPRSPPPRAKRFTKEEVSALLSQRMRDNNPMKRPDVVAKMVANHQVSHGKDSPIWRARWSKPGERQKQADKMRKANPMRRPEVAAQQASTLSQKHKNDPEFHKRVLKWLREDVQSPNRQEVAVDAVLKSTGYPFMLNVRAHEVIMALGESHGHIPDWIWKEKRLVIEYNGWYWHEKIEKPDCQEGCYEKAGYRCLILREREVAKRLGSPEMRDSLILDLVQQFVEGGRGP